jgi:hypothetical protein
MTRRAPTLSIFQRDGLCQVAERLTPGQRSTFYAAVTSRLSGSPSDAAVAQVAITVRAEIERGEQLAVRI